MPLNRPDGEFDFTNPFINGYYKCYVSGKLYRALFLLHNPLHRAQLLNLLKIHPFPYPATVVYNGRTLIFSMNNGFVSIASATFDIARDEIINVKTSKLFRRRGLSRVLLNFIVRYFGPSYITASATPGQGGAPTGDLLNFYSSLGYQIIPNSSRLTIMSNLAAIKQREREREAEEKDENEVAATEVAGAVPLDDAERNAFTAIRATSGVDAARTLNKLYALLHEPNAAEIARLISAQSPEPSAIVTAIAIYNQEWFDNRPWAPYHKAEFAQAMATMLLNATGRRNSLWDKIAGQA